MKFVITLLLAAPLLPAAAFAQDQKSWNAHLQSTCIRQIQPAFHSPYEGAQSLRGERAGFTLTADVRRVADPGYNMDRGLAAFYALRLHWES